MRAAFLPVALLAELALGACSTPASLPSPTNTRDGVTSGLNALHAGAPLESSGRNVGEWLDELSPLFESPDPQLRDGLAYELAARWIVSERNATPEDLRRVLGPWIARLKVRAGETSDAGALRRSFHALALSLVAARDLDTPFLSPAELEQLLGAALDYLASEPDERGWDPQLGWVHATAHCADLLKFLARNPRLDSAARVRILDGLAARATRPCEQPFAWGEDQRLAAAAGAALLRVEASVQARFAAALRVTLDPDAPFDARRLAGQLNAEHVRDALLARLEEAAAQSDDAAAVRRVLRLDE
jgi:hypothetical protein